MFPMPPHVAHAKTIAVDPRDPKTIYVGVEQGGFFKTVDGGQNWRELEFLFATPRTRRTGTCTRSCCARTIPTRST